MKKQSFSLLLLSCLMLILLACGDDDKETQPIVENGQATIDIEMSGTTITHATPFNHAEMLSDNGFLTLTHIIANPPQHALIISYFGDFGEVTQGQTLRSAFNDSLGFTYSDPGENISATGISVVLHISTLDRDTNTISGHYDFSGTNVNATVEDITNGDASVSGSGQFSNIQYSIQ